MLKKLKKLRAIARRVYKSLFFPPFIIFAAILLVTYWSFLASTESVKRDQSTAIATHKNTIDATITQRLATYEEILIGGAGLFKASDTVTDTEWHNYIGTYDVSNRYPGVQTIGYIKVAHGAAELNNLVASMHSQGITNFAVRPNTPRNTYTAVLYTEPNRHAHNIGLDIYTEPSRRNAMDQARDSGLVSITEPAKAIQATTDQLVFTMFVPQYQQGMPTETREQRQRALQGFVYAAFRTDDFFNKLLPATVQDSRIGLRVTAATSNESQPFFQTADYDAIATSRQAVTASQQIDLYGKGWQIDYAFEGGTLAGANRRNAPFFTLLFGSLFGILLAQVVYLLLKSRAQDLTKQRDRAVDVAKDELLSLASHQLRTPATAVKQYLGMVLQGFAGQVTKQQEGLLEKAYAGNERQLFIINEMLHIAKIDAGRITLAKQRTNLNDLLQTIVTDSQNEAKTAGHKLKLIAPKRPIILTVDEHMLRMAIENILSNAIKYTPSRGKITVTLKRKSKTAIIAISDTGVGIAETDMPKLYKLFSRLNNRLTATVSGTGVGLYLAKHLVELHDGSIELQSQPGKGSTFSIILPEMPGNVT